MTFIVVIIGILNISIPTSQIVIGAPVRDLAVSGSMPTDMEFVVIPAGSFSMGSPVNEDGRDEDETLHTVTLDSFEILNTEVTQAMWESVMGSGIDDHKYNYSFQACTRGVGPHYPMYYMSWYDCQSFINCINQLDSEYFYRLPTEAEWEYACRAGTTSRFFWGDNYNESIVSQYCWAWGCGSRNYRMVATGLPNAWGLYDMSGNVWEWCEDVYTDDYQDCPVDGSAYVPEGGVHRVMRGGSRGTEPRECRSAYRRVDDPGSRYVDYGFRLIRVPK